MAFTDPPLVTSITLDFINTRGNRQRASVVDSGVVEVASSVLIIIVKICGYIGMHKSDMYGSALMIGNEKVLGLGLMDVP